MASLQVFSPSFDSVSNEVLEVIFSHLTYTDLIQSTAKVCQRWNDVIARPKFQYWKKAYYSSVLHGSPTLPENMTMPDDSFPLDQFKDKIISTQTYTSPNGEKQPIELIVPRLMYKIVKEFERKSFEGIELHRKYSWAERVVQKRFKFAVNESGKAIDVAVIMTLCYIAEDVWDVREIVKVLQHPRTTCTSLDISELLYCIAGHIYLHYKCRDTETETVPGLSQVHYMIYHVLYFFENDWTYDPSRNDKPKKTNSGQASLLDFGFRKKDFSLTAEQWRIVNHPIKASGQELIKIVAFAGTGKTTTLVRLCQKNPQLKFLLVVYNKSAKENAASLFPKNNVKCMTAHGMAMQKAGFMFSKKLTSNLKAKDILDSGLMSQETSEGGMQRRAAQVVKTLESFMNTQDFEMTMEHVPSVWRFGPTETVLDARQRDLVLNDAMAVWSVMADKDDMRVRMPHDGYMKVWQLRKPNLQYVAKHDVLLVDEGQDMNPTLLDIFSRQETPKIIVGDPNQQIYTFRGAVNALDKVEADETFHLTQSFRFGPEIAFIANNLVTCLKAANKGQFVVGGKKVDRIVMRRGASTDGASGQVAFIARSNRELFDHVAKVVSELSPDSRLKGSFVGGIKSYNFQDLVEIQRMRSSETAKWRWFKSYQQLVSFAEHTDDAELTGKIKIVEKYGENLPGIIDKITRHNTDNPKLADYIYSTAHKSKGLEWNRVVLLDDFATAMPITVGPHANNAHSPQDEINLLYVALTRAKNQLTLNKQLRTFLKLNANMFGETIELRSDIDPSAKCDDCKEVLSTKESSVLIVRTAEMGYLCPQCSAADVRIEEEESFTFQDPEPATRIYFDTLHTVRRFFTGPEEKGTRRRPIWNAIVEHQQIFYDYDDAFDFID